MISCHLCKTHAHSLTYFSTLSHYLQYMYFTTGEIQYFKLNYPSISTFLVCWNLFCLWHWYACVSAWMYVCTFELGHGLLLMFCDQLKKFYNFSFTHMVIVVIETWYWWYGLLNWYSIHHPNRLIQWGIPSTVKAIVMVVYSQVIRYRVTLMKFIKYTETHTTCLLINRKKVCNGISNCVSV